MMQDYGTTTKLNVGLLYIERKELIRSLGVSQATK